MVQSGIRTKPVGTEPLRARRARSWARCLALFLRQDAHALLCTLGRRVPPHRGFRCWLGWRARHSFRASPLRSALPVRCRIPSTFLRCSQLPRQHHRMTGVAVRLVVAAFGPIVDGRSSTRSSPLNFAEAVVPKARLIGDCGTRREPLEGSITGLPRPRAAGSISGPRVRASLQRGR